MYLSGNMEDIITLDVHLIIIITQHPYIPSSLYSLCTI